MPKLMREIDGLDKYLVLDRFGRKVHGVFVLKSTDPHAPAALLAYQDHAIEHGPDGEYAESVGHLAKEWQDKQALSPDTLGHPEAGVDNRAMRRTEPTVLGALAVTDDTARYAVSRRS